MSIEEQNFVAMEINIVKAPQKIRIVGSRLEDEEMMRKIGEGTGLKEHLLEAEYEH